MVKLIIVLSVIVNHEIRQRVSKIISISKILIFTSDSINK